MGFEIRKAKRSLSKLRMAIIAPSGAGKTYTALRIARGLAGPTGRILGIDTERGSMDLYSDMPEVAGEYDVLRLETFAPATYVKALECAAKENYDVVIIDSLSHAWMGKDGALEMVDSAAKRSNAGNSFAAWRDVTPEHNRMVDAMLICPFHLLVTMRSKTEWVLEENEKGKKVPRKIGMQPVQRDGLEYEFTVVGDMDTDHNLIISKSRCSALADQVFKRPNGEVSRILNEWLSGADPEPPRRAPAPATQPVAPPQNAEVMTLVKAACAAHGEKAVKAHLKELGYAKPADVPLFVIKAIVDHGVPAPEPVAATSAPTAPSDPVPPAPTEPNPGDF